MKEDTPEELGQSEYFRVFETPRRAEKRKLGRRRYTYEYFPTIKNRGVLRTMVNKVRDWWKFTEI
jgi:hypothetical protein